MQAIIACTEVAPQRLHKLPAGILSNITRKVSQPSKPSKGKHSSKSKRSDVFGTKVVPFCAYLRSGRLFPTCTPGATKDERALGLGIATLDVAFLTPLVAIACRDSHSQGGCKCHLGLWSPLRCSHTTPCFSASACPTPSGTYLSFLFAPPTRFVITCVGLHLRSSPPPTREKCEKCLGLMYPFYYQWPTQRCFKM